jgi:hypothetical protein
MLGRRTRAALLSAVVALGSGIALPSMLSVSADAAADDYSVSNWKDPNGKVHRVRWDPCTTITYAVNVEQAGATEPARQAALLDAQKAMARAAARAGLTVSFAGRTTEIPRDAGEDWQDRQTAAEIVIAWVDQDQSATRSNLLIGGASGTGGWVWQGWLHNGSWKIAIGRGFVVIDADHNRKYAPGFGSGTTRGALLMHEIGHALGLGHVGTTSELMYSQILNRSATRYGYGDRNGLTKVGKSLGCIPGTRTAWKQI